MTTTCHLCQTPGDNQHKLVHTKTGAHVSVCTVCVRTKTHAKAARKDPRARQRLEQQAQRTGTELWRSETTLYLTPPILPSLEDETVMPQSSPPSKSA